MIRFAPSTTPTSSQQSIKAADYATSPKPKEEQAASAAAKVANKSDGISEREMLLVELPEASAPVPPKTIKARSPRKPKAKPEATAMELDLNT